MKLNFLPLLLVFFGVVSAAGVNSAEVFMVKGEIAFKEQGTIYVTLVTEEQFAAGVPGLGQVLEVGPAETEAGKVAFAFEKISPGVYAVKSFQDVNGNGELDSGALGPKEPWGMYRDARPTFRAPKFEEVKFEVNRNLDDIRIILK